MTVPGEVAPVTTGVVIAVRNGAETIREAVDSVLRQVPAVARVVIVDGASSDGTLECLPDDDRVEVVPQLGRGLGAARNQGIALLDTDLVGFCDADDRWLPGALAVRVAHLRDRPEVAAVAGRVVMSTRAPASVPAHRRSGLGTVADGYTPGAVLVRRAMAGRFDETLALACDTLWLARLVDSGAGLDLIEDVVLDKSVGAGTLSTDLDAYGRELLVVVRELAARRRAGRGRGGPSPTPPGSGRS